MPQTQTQTKPQSQKKRKKRRRRRSQPHAAVILLLVLTAALLALLLLLHGALRRGQPEPEPVETAPSVTETLPPSQLDARYFGWDGNRKTYCSPGGDAVPGIDVSAFQGDVDWAAVAESGVKYAILRAGFRGYSDGRTKQDEYFTYNLEQAAANGLDVGVYFFSQATNEPEARAEADEVLAMVDGHALQYPIYFDWEPVSDQEARTASISSSDLTACAKAFCEVVEEAGYEAGVYFNLSLATHYYHLYELKDYSFWLAEYQDAPSFPFQVDLWQYTNQGEVPGIYEAVDLNLSFREIS